MNEEFEKKFQELVNKIYAAGMKAGEVEVDKRKIDGDCMEFLSYIKGKLEVKNSDLVQPDILEG